MLPRPAPALYTQIMDTTLTKAYEHRISTGALREDAGQRAALGALEALRQALNARAAEAATTKGAFLSVLNVFRGRPENTSAPRGIYLWGGVGRGKSMLMDLFFDTLTFEQKRRVHFHAFMQDIHKGMHLARQRGVDDALTPVAEAISTTTQLLAFDEMQITDITDAMIVGRLFEKLMRAGVVIVATSNRPPKDLYKDGLNRPLFLPFITMLTETLDVIELDSPHDYRQQQLAGEKVYFISDRQARERIDLLWHNLTRGGAAEKTSTVSGPLTLRVTGREIVLERYANGVARARFNELCATSFGPADYLAIASALRVLILEDIPVLTASHYNEAKRFVMLIDALYEAKVRLIASAQDEPERLYREGRGAFEFARTASRLREMQSVDWGRAPD